MEGLPQLSLWLWVVAILPIALVLVLMMFFKWSGGKSGILAWFLTLIIAGFFFGGNLQILTVGTLKGLWVTLWTLYIVWGAMTVYNVVDLVGGFKVIANTFTRLTHGNKALQLLTMGWAFPSFLQGVCGFGTPVAVSAPILVGLGFNPIFAAAVPLIGHSWAVTFGSLGSSYSVLTRMTDLDPQRLAVFGALFLGICCIMVGFSIAHIYGGWKAMKENALAVLIIGLTMAITLNIMADYVVPNVASFTAGALGLVVGGLVVPRLYKVKSEEEVAASNAAAEKMPISFNTAFFVYSVLLIVVFVVYLIAPLKAYLGDLWKWGYPFPETQTAFGFTNEAVEKYSSMAMFTAPGTLIFLSALIGYLYYSHIGIWPKNGGRMLVNRLVKQAIGATVTVTTMSMMSGVMLESGMTHYLAWGLSVTGPVYAIFSPWIGVLGAFMTGSNTNSNVLFTTLQWQVAQLLQISPFVILGLQTTGGAIGNMFCPMNVALGTGVTNQVGREGEILNRTALYTAIQTFVVGIIAWIMLYILFPGIK